jgi:pentatricopeptide repeat protein
MQAIGLNLNQLLKYYADQTSKGIGCDFENILVEIKNQNADLVEGNKVSLIQIMCHLGKEDEAINYLQNNNITRLGAYVPILSAYIKRNNLVKVWQIYEEMLQKNIMMKHEHYCLLLGWLLNNNYQNEFDKILTDMCSARIIPDKSVWIIISKRFEHFNVSVPTENGLCKKCNTKHEVIDVPEARKIMCDILESKITNHSIWQQFINILQNNK